MIKYFLTNKENRAIAIISYGDDYYEFKDYKTGKTIQDLSPQAVKELKMIAVNGQPYYTIDEGYKHNFYGSSLLFNNAPIGSGEQGPPGMQGIQGIKGDKGDTGDQGIQGIKGDKGDTGDQGIQGPIGPSGVAEITRVLATGNLFSGLYNYLADIPTYYYGYIEFNSSNTTSPTLNGVPLTFTKDSATILANEINPNELYFIVGTGSEYQILSGNLGGGAKWQLIFEGELQGNATAINLDTSPYRLLRIWYQGYSVAGSFLLDLEHPLSLAYQAGWSYQGGGCIPTWTGSALSMHYVACAVNSDKSQFRCMRTGYYNLTTSTNAERINTNNYFVYKIEGLR